MTKDELLTAEAGTELDSFVAEKVMRWRWFDGRGTAGPSYWDALDGSFGHIAEFEPSDDMNDAMDVVERMVREGYDFELSTYDGEQYSCNFLVEGAEPISAPTAALAICKAAVLVAMEVE